MTCNGVHGAKQTVLTCYVLHVYAVGGGDGSTMAMYIKGMLHEAKAFQYNITPVTKEGMWRSWRGRRVVQ